MPGYLIKDTTREEREQIVADSLENIEATCDGCGSGLVEMYQAYIDGEKELRAAAETWKARAAGSFSELGRRAVRLARMAGRWVSDVFVFWREFLGRPFRRLTKRGPTARRHHAKTAAALC